MGDDRGGLPISPDGVAPSRMVGVCACYLPLHHKSSGDFFWHWLTQVVAEKGRKTVACVYLLLVIFVIFCSVINQQIIYLNQAERHKQQKQNTQIRQTDKRVRTTENKMLRQMRSTSYGSVW